MNRRRFLAACSLAGGTGLGLFSITLSAATNVRALQQRWPEFVRENLKLPSVEDKVSKAKKEWRQELPRDAYNILFEESTERQFSSDLNGEKRRGVYVCRACELPLFTSEMKFDSGTGWPSFFTHIAGHFATKKDYKILWPRTEYHCARCGGHHGHVFDDGPQPTGERWCNNGLALRFYPLNDDA